MISAEPDYDAALGSIKYLKADQLQDLIDHDDKITKLLNDLPQVLNLRTEKESLLRSNKELAELNLSFEDKLSTGRNELITKYEESSKLSEELSSLKNELKSDVGVSKYSSDTLQALLQTSAQELEEESEEMVNKFLDNEQNVDDFVSDFVTMKTRGHERRIRAEKITEMIKSGRVRSGSYSKTTPVSTPYPTAATSTPYPSTSATSTPYPSTASRWSTPYPTQPMKMPMPGF